jgi:hypothetical protein
MPERLDVEQHDVSVNTLCGQYVASKVGSTVRVADVSHDLGRGVADTNRQDSRITGDSPVGPLFLQRFYEAGNFRLEVGAQIDIVMNDACVVVGRVLDNPIEQFKIRARAEFNLDMGRERRMMTEEIAAGLLGSRDNVNHTFLNL